MAYDNILLDITDGIGRVTLNRPAALNALNEATGKELLQAFEELRDNESVRVVVVAGTGRAFSSGGDVKEMVEASGQDPREFLERLLGQLNRAIQTLYEMPKPTLAAINGLATGIGFNLALAADFRIATRSAQFIQGFVKIGLVPDGGGTFLLPRLIGWGRALELMLTARAVPADEAYSLGIVTQVVDDAELAATVEAWARQCAQAPTGTIDRIKKLLRYSQTSDFGSQLQHELDIQAECIQTADFREGIRAFVEKRPPRFTGK